MSPGELKETQKSNQHLNLKGFQFLPTMAHFYGSPGRLKKMMARLTKFLLPFYRKGCLNSEEPRRPLPKVSTSNLLLTSPFIKS